MIWNYEIDMELRDCRWNLYQEFWVVYGREGIVCMGSSIAHGLLGVCLRLEMGVV